MRPSGRRRLRFDCFEVDIHTSELRKGNSPIRLSVKPFQFLTLLLEKAGEAVTREEIRDRLWAHKPSATSTMV
jgi:DNA-binding response OmpR family regulator